MSAYRLKDNWSPVWWEPVLWEGSSWSFTARLTGLTPGTITGGTLYLDGNRYPVGIYGDILKVTVSYEQWRGVSTGAPAQLFLDTTAGRVLWLHGALTVGGTRP